MLNIITTMFDHIVNTTTYLFVYGNQCGNVLKKIFNISHPHQSLTVECDN